MTTDVRLTSGLTRTVFFIFFYNGSPFFLVKNEKKIHFFPKKQGHPEAAEAEYMPTVHRWWDGQSKQTRQTYRQSIQTTPRQFTEGWKRIIRPRKDATKELKNIRVKLN